MADTSKLVFEATTEGGTAKFSYNYADPEASVTNVRAAAQALVANGDILADRPLTITSAKLVTTTTTAYQLSE